MQTEKPKFTKGPWTVEEYLRGLLRIRGGKSDCIIAQLFTGETDEWESTKNYQANAHLIVAAPEMYKALETMREEYREDGSSYVTIDEDAVLAALTKARGLQ